MHIRLPVQYSTGQSIHNNTKSFISLRDHRRNFDEKPIKRFAAIFAEASRRPSRSATAALTQLLRSQHKTITATITMSSTKKFVPAVYDGFVDAIGNTPLIYLQGPSERTGCKVYGKAEFLNPGGSVVRPRKIADDELASSLPCLSHQTIMSLSERSRRQVFGRRAGTRRQTAARWHDCRRNGGKYGYRTGLRRCC